MRRTTIFRSRGAHLAAVALALGCIAAPSQLAAQQPRPAQPPGPPPATHVVQKGETLWWLAQQFLGDPLLWPEIYRLNTTVVEDPHWIFPGEELRLVPGPETAAAPGAQAQPGAPGDTTSAQAPQAAEVNPATAPTIFAGQAAFGPSRATLQLRNQQAYRAVRQGEYYSAGFLTEGEQLNAGTLLGNEQTASISRLTSATSAMLFSDVAVSPPPGDSLKPGDLLLVYEVPGSVPDYGAVVRPTGLLKVTVVRGADQNVTARVIGVYQTIASGQKVIRVEPFHASPGGVRGTPIDSGIVGEVIDLRDPHELVTIQDVLFINRGAEDGVHLGDVFQVSRVASSSSGIGSVVQDEAKVLVVYTRPHTATALIIEILRPDIRRGATARQIRRMPS